MKVKEINFAYPTSISATKFGFSKTGCYVVQRGESGRPLIAVAAYATKSEAMAHADRLPEPWSAATLYLRREEYENDQP